MKIIGCFVIILLLSTSCFTCKIIHTEESSNTQKQVDDLIDSLNKTYD